MFHVDMCFYYMDKKHKFSKRIGNLPKSVGKYSESVLKSSFSLVRIWNSKDFLMIFHILISENLENIQIVSWQ